MEKQEEGEKLPSKNSEFIRAGRDTMREMRTEIEGKKRGDRNTEAKKAESNKAMMRWRERERVCVSVVLCVSFIPSPCCSIHKGQ